MMATDGNVDDDCDDDVCDDVFDLFFCCRSSIILALVATGSAASAGVG
jgi:hypothetical protein